MLINMYISWHRSVVFDSLRPHDCSRPGSSVRGVIQAGIMEWVAIPFPRDLPYPGIKPTSLSWQADSSPSEPQGKPRISWTHGR